jgi:hypothetical protein
MPGGRRPGNNPAAAVASSSLPTSRYARGRSSDSIGNGGNGGNGSSRYGASRSRANRNDGIGDSIYDINNNNNNNGINKSDATSIPVLQSNGNGNGSGTASSSSSQTRTSGTPSKSSGGSSNSKKKAAEAAAAAFYPKLITAQILALQCLHYFLLAVCIQINSVLYRTSITIDRIFTDEYVRLWSKQAGSWADVSAILLVSLVGAVLLAMIVEKSKKCLDFAVTLFLIHLVMCTLYGGFPTVLDWWVVQVTGTILMVLLGEYLCSLRELGDIPLLQL